MSTLGKIARGMVIGGANYFGLMAQQELEERKSAILSAREQALEKLRHSNRLDEIKATAEANAGLETVKTDERIRETEATVGPLTDAKIRETAAKEEARLKADLTMAGVKFKQDITLTELREKHQTNRTLINEAGEDRRQQRGFQHDIDTNPVMTVENAAGEPTAVFGEGAKRRTLTARGGKNKAGGESGGSILDQYGAGGSSGGGMVPAAAKPAAADYREWDQLKAEIATDARFKNLSASEKIAKARELATLGGIPTRPGE